MPRKPRIEFDGAFYHVITHGSQRQNIFRESADYGKYLQILSIYKNRYHRLYAYVLMGNHIHLIIERKNSAFQRYQGINQSFTLYFNRRYETDGHLFQGRYKAILCDRDKCLLVLRLGNAFTKSLRSRHAKSNMKLYDISEKDMVAALNAPEIATREHSKTIAKKNSEGVFPAFLLKLFTKKQKTESSS